MKSFTAYIAVAFFALAELSLAQQLTINTPVAVVECEPTQLTWSGGQSPYYLSLVPAGQPTAPALKQFPTQTGTSYTWNVDLGSGASFNIALKDSTGAQAFSSIVTVTAGSSTTCANSSVTETGGTSGTATAVSGSPASSGSASPSSGSSQTTAKPSGSSGSSSASGSASSSRPSNAASRSTVGAFGVAGIMGLVGAALF